MHCRSCENRNYNIKQKKTCEVCNTQLEIAGPLWIGQLFNKKFVIDMIRQIPKFVVNKKCLPILEKCVLESEMPPTYYTIDKIASKMQRSPIKIKNAIDILQNEGFLASPTSLNPTGFRTDCRIDKILQLFKS